MAPGAEIAPGLGKADWLLALSVGSGASGVALWCVLAWFDSDRALEAFLGRVLPYVSDPDLGVVLLAASLWLGCSGLAVAWRSRSQPRWRLDQPGRFVLAVSGVAAVVTWSLFLFATAAIHALGL